MLEYNHGVTIKIASIYQSQCGIFVNDEDPADVTVKEPLVRRIRIRVCVCKSMVQSMS